MLAGVWVWKKDVGGITDAENDAFPLDHHCPNRFTVVVCGHDFAEDRP